MRVYAPYIPLLVIVGCGITLSNQAEFNKFNGTVRSFATNTTDDGLLEATNQKRISEGLKPLKFNKSLDIAAQAKAQDMSDRNYWAHVTPDGKQPWVFVDATNYSYRKAAENLAYGFANSNTTVAGWMNSPGHRANVMDPDLREVGFGIINVPDYQSKGPQTVVVAMYGQPSVLADSNSVQLPVTPVTASAQPEKISYVQS